MGNVRNYGSRDPNSDFMICVPTLTYYEWRNAQHALERLTINLYNDLKVLNLEKLYQKNICSHIHQHKDKLINYKEVPYSLRKTNIIERPKCKTTKGQKYIMYIGLGLYNKLPHEIKLEDKAQNFKYKLKDWLCKNDLSSG